MGKCQLCDSHINGRLWDSVKHKGVGLLEQAGTRWETMQEPLEQQIELGLTINHPLPPKVRKSQIMGSISDEKTVPTYLNVLLLFFLTLAKRFSKLGCVSESTFQRDLSTMVLRL